MSSPATRLGVIGDVHAESERLRQAIEFLETRNVDAVICTGDIVDGLGCPDTSAQLLESAGVHTVRGNHDRWVLEDKARHVPLAHRAEDLATTTRDFLHALPRQLTIETIAGNLLLCHGVGNNDLKKVWPGTERMAAERCSRLDALISEGGYRFMINGHMHFRTIIHFEGLTLINAGTLKGDRWPGFSTIDFAENQICAFEFRNGNIELATTLPLAPQPEHTVWENTQSFSGNWEPVRLFDSAAGAN